MSSGETRARDPNRSVESCGRNDEISTKDEEAESGGRGETKGVEADGSVMMTASYMAKERTCIVCVRAS